MRTDDLHLTNDDLRMLAPEDVAHRLGWSLRTLDRRAAAGTGPIITKLSPRRRGIRADHLRQWLDQQGTTVAA